MVGKRYVTDADVKQGVMPWLQAHDTDFFCAGLQPCCQGETYAPSWSDVYQYHQMPMCDVYMKVGVKFLASECLSLILELLGPFATPTSNGRD
jgi:hypothetical protein